MNKKILSILIIFSLLAVGLTGISSANETIEETTTNDETDTTEEPVIESENTEPLIATDDENTTDNATDNSTDEKTEPDILAPTNTEDLNKFYILMNFVTQDGLNALADNLKAIDENKYQDVINSLRTNNRETLIKNVASLNQEDIDTFFNEFLKLFDTTSTTQEDNDDGVISNTVNKILGKEANSDTSNIKHNYIKVNNNPASTPEFKIENKTVSIVEFIIQLQKLYENGDITFEEFIQELEDQGIDTSDIKVDEYGIIEWGYLNIIPQNNVEIPDENDTINETSANDTESTPADESSVETDSASSNEAEASEAEA